MDIVLKIEGMGCAHCIAAIRTILEDSAARDIGVEMGLARFIIDDGEKLQGIIERIHAQGYRVVDALDN